MPIDIVLPRLNSYDICCKDTIICCKGTIGEINKGKVTVKMAQSEIYK